MKVNTGVVTRLMREMEVKALAARIDWSSLTRAMIAYTTNVAMGARFVGALAA
jgi:hypothetical protein